MQRDESVGVRPRCALERDVELEELAVAEVERESSARLADVTHRDRQAERVASGPLGQTSSQSRGHGKGVHGQCPGGPKDGQ